MENLTKELDNKKITVGVFKDLKKAFDTIDHSMLIKKLEYYGIRGVPLNWLKSYGKVMSRDVPICNLLASGGGPIHARVPIQAHPQFS